MPPALGLAALCLLARPAHAAPLRVSQSVGVYRDGGGASVPGETTVGWTSLASSGRHWRWRGALSWWRWRPDDETGPAADAGIGSLHLSLGRHVWDTGNVLGQARGWVRVKGAVPLDDAPTPVSSGRIDWGGSLLAAQRIRELFVLVELGFLEPGDPVDVDYTRQFSGAVSVNWHHRRFPVYPVASFATASPLVDGSPQYAEWAVGLGSTLGARAGLWALYSHGLNTGSPGRGLTAAVSYRI